MTYKDKFYFLLTLIILLALVYTGSFVFSPERRNERSASYIWLDSKSAATADRIVIDTPWYAIELVKKNNRWFILHDGYEFPARQTRIEDFLEIFSVRSLWPVRSSNASSHSRFGLETETASRLTVYNRNSRLMDLLIGDDDFSGQINIRRFAHNEVRSGGGRISSYIINTVNSWHNLRLIPETENRSTGINDVQRLSVFNEGETMIFSRLNREWVISGADVSNPDQNSIENYIYGVINAEGDSFADPLFADDLIFNHGRIVLEMGNGDIIIIRFSERDESGRLFAHVNSGGYVYSIPAWTAARLFTDSSSFQR